MQAGLITGARKFECLEVPEPILAPGAAIIDITLCGICGSDVMAFKQGGAYPDGLCGHEWVGLVREVAPGVTAVRPGERVICSAPPPCGLNCEPCRQGHYGACLIAVAAMCGMDGFSPSSGGFAPRHAVDARRLLVVPEALSDIQAAMVEPATVATHGVRRSKMLPGDRVGVMGAGPIGLFALQSARAAGAERVVVVEPDEGRRRLALSLGADYAWAPGGEAEEGVAELTNKLGLDSIFDCAGVTTTLQAAAGLARQRGTVTIVGFAAGQANVEPGMWLMKELVVRGSLGYDKDDTLSVVSMMERGQIKVDEMHSGTVKLADTAAIFADLAGRSGNVKILVDSRD